MYSIPPLPPTIAILNQQSSPAEKLQTNIPTTETQTIKNKTVNKTIQTETTLNKSQTTQTEVNTVPHQKC